MSSFFAWRVLATGLPKERAKNVFLWAIEIIGGIMVENYRARLGVQH